MEDEEDEAPRRRVAGFSLPFDVARRFAQPLGIHLDEWESRIIQTEKGVVRLRPVTERGKELFGESGADTLADEIETNAAASAQLSLFPDEPPAVRGRSRRRGRLSGVAVRQPGRSDSRRRHWTGFTPPCCSRRRAAPKPCATCCGPNRNAAPTSCAWPTLYPPSIPGAAKKSDCWTECCWQRPGSPSEELGNGEY